MSGLLSVRGLSKRYGDTVAVDGLDLQLSPGDVLGLLGPNGAGKTTTVECILGLRQPDAGVVEVNGIDAIKDAGQVKSIIGAQLQSTRLHEKLTPREALQLFASFYQDAEDPEALLDRFSIRDKATAPYDSLSGGQRQRLALALAFVNRPRLLILDEPTVGLDPTVRRDVFAAIDVFRAEGGAVLLCTHQLDEAQRHCDRLVIIDQGRKLVEGSPEELIRKASAQSRIHFQLQQEAGESLLSQLNHIGSIERCQGGYSLVCVDPSQTVAALTARLRDAGLGLRELRIEGPSVEDAYHALTGHAWPDVSDDVKEGDS